MYIGPDWAFFKRKNEAVQRKPKGSRTDFISDTQESRQISYILGTPEQCTKPEKTASEIKRYNICLLGLSETRGDLTVEKRSCFPDTLRREPPD